METKDLHVLVCDDSLLIRKKMTDILKKAGIVDIREVENGQFAIDACKERSPHLVFMDIVMPEKDGIAALTEIKEHNANIEVVMASSAGTQFHLKKAIQLGAFDFIQKPVDAKHVKNILEKFLTECEESHV